MKKCRTCKQWLELDKFKQIYLKEYNKMCVCSNVCNDCINSRKIKENKRNRGYLIKIKIQLIQEMGGKCVCCGLTQWWILTFDHILPLKGKNRTHSYTLYYKLLNNLELRKEFQIMCYGCNISKMTGKYCTLDHR